MPLTEGSLLVGRSGRYRSTAPGDAEYPAGGGAQGAAGAQGAQGAAGAVGAQGAAGAVMAAGGADGQGLVKNSATDFDTEWADVLRVVIHGANDAVARPAAAAVYWVGSVAPGNAADGDLWTVP